jgi:hemerythrin-like metal-binding protein
MKNYLKEKKIITNIEKLDKQHSILFKLIKKLKTILSLGEPDYAEMINVLAELNAYTSFHFKTEEAFFEEHGYKNLDLHRAKHQSFIEQVEAFSLENALGTPGLGEEMLEFLEDWLIIHIQHLDVSACRQLNLTDKKDIGK